jgi:transketolase
VDGVRRAARACSYVLTLEEHTVIGGLGGAVAEACLEGGVALRGFARVGLDDLYPSEVGDQNHLRVHYQLDRLAVARRLRAMLEGDRPPPIVPLEEIRPDR